MSMDRREDGLVENARVCRWVASGHCVVSAGSGEEVEDLQRKMRSEFNRTGVVPKGPRLLVFVAKEDVSPTVGELAADLSRAVSTFAPEQVREFGELRAALDALNKRLGIEGDDGQEDEGGGR